MTPTTPTIPTTRWSAPKMRDPTEAIVDAVDELAAEPPGDVLVFLSGSAKSVTPPTLCAI